MAAFQWNFDPSDKGYPEFSTGLREYGYLSKTANNDRNKYWDPRRKLWVHAPLDEYLVAPIKNSQLGYSTLDLIFVVYADILRQWDQYKNTDQNPIIYWQPLGLRWVVIKEKYPTVLNNKQTAPPDSGPGGFPPVVDTPVKNIRVEAVKTKIAELTELLEKGIITQEQFNIQVQKILDEYY